MKLVKLILLGFTMITSLCFAKDRNSVQSILDGMVKIPDKNFWISETEVTQGQWKSVMGNNPSGHKGSNLPVENVSKNDADIFIRRLNECAEIRASKYEFDLPTIDEWVTVASAGGPSIEEQAWVKENSNNATHDVATKKPNAYGVYDIFGNVWEWMAGFHNGKGARRGGSYCDNASSVSARRWIHTPCGRRYDSCGLRVAAYLRGSRGTKTEENAHPVTSGQNKQPSNNDSNTRTYQKCKDAIAVVEGDVVDGRYGRGTGFLCEMAGKKYFVTNKHVATQRGKITAYFLDGQIMEFRPDAMIEVAENRDLVRFEVQTSRACLKLLDSVPSIGEAVEFYGNAEGQKVITVTTGRVLAVGQEEVEIDSQIQAGNSGSPLVREVDGLVIGVTTRSKFNKVDDPSKIGTRFDPNVKLTREFAVRFTSVLWTSKQYGEFLNIINTNKDLWEFWDLMRKVCTIDNPAMILSYAIPDLKFSYVTMLNSKISAISQCDEALRKARDSYEIKLVKNKLGSQHQRSGQAELENAKKRIRDNMVKSYRVRREVLESVLSYIKKLRSLASADRALLEEAFDWQLRIYCEKYRMELSGVVVLDLK